MQALSRALVCLYEAAEHVSVKTYPAEAMRLVRSLIALDGGVLGTGTAQSNAVPDLVIECAYIYQRDQMIVPDYAWLAARDPLARCLAAGLSAPLACQCRDFYREQRLPGLEAFCRRHALSHLMLFGDSGSCVHAAQWIVLYRSADQSFSELDRQYLMALWPHIKQASAINRRHCLDWHARSRNTRAAALANQHGVIEAAHPYFRDLLCLEWPDFTSNRLPDALTESWRQGRAYIGSRIRVAMHMEEELLVCVAMQVAMPPPLTQAERIVASQFAEGASYKAIAEQLCVSQHTIRSHIAHIYAKLDVHDKAALANKLNQGLDAGLNQDT